MKVNFTRLATFALLMGVNYSAFCQNWLTNGNNVTAGQFLGSINNQPLLFRTANVNRMHINGNGIITNGANASGFIGIGTNVPSAPLHIVGTQVANAQGWRRGLTLSNNAILQWEVAADNGFFMGHPSNTPGGNWFAGMNSTALNNSAVDYVYTIYVNDNFGGLNPLGTTQFFKNLLVIQPGFERRFGVNVLEPARVTEIFDDGNAITDAQLRLSTANNAFTDFRTQHAGSMIISPQSGRVGITSGGTNIDPTANLDINGNVRIRNVQTGIANSLLIGTNVSGSTDVNVRRLDFSGNSNHVLLGNGTWGSVSSTGFGNYCNAPQNNLTSSYQIPMNNQNFYFTNNDVLGQNHIGIGIPCNANLSAKLTVHQSHPTTVDTSTTSVTGYNDDVANTYGLDYNGVFGTAVGVQALEKTLNRGGYFTAKNSGYAMGVMGEVDDIHQVNGNAYAGNFEAKTGATNNFAVKAMAFAYPSNNQNIGVMAEAMNSNFQNIGGLFRTYGFQGQTSTNIGVVGTASPLTVPMTIPAGANIGVYGNSASLIDITGVSIGFAGFFDGNVWINGPATGTGYASTFSDANFKTNVLNQENANTILNQLNPKTFYFDTLNSYGLHFNAALQHGLIAQEVEVILPELVHNQRKPAMLDSIGNVVTPELNYKALDYSALISVLIKGHQEQGLIIESLQSSNDSLHAQVDEINNRLTQLESCLSGILPFLCQLSQQAIQTNTPDTQQAIRSQLAVYLENKETIILDQNVPNPFAEQTVINFSIPESVKNAQILFYNGLGALINTVEIKERGLGSLVVFGSDLSSGTYMYTLIADGIIVSTKKMVKQ
ncbi:MAG: tail fiber domain-containing protein [Crocinitomicaceae bacterium]|nr:tail fiber domain-containing protein [Crocinitomicaceae bacterium]